MTEGQYQALRDEIALAVEGALAWNPYETDDDAEMQRVAEVVMPIVQREVAARDAVIEQIRALAEKARKSLHAPCVLTPFDLGHIDRDLREIERLLSSLPSTGETK